MKYLFLLLGIIGFLSCEKDETPVQSLPDLEPEIIIDWGVILNSTEVFVVRLHNNGSITTLPSIFYIQKMDPVATCIFPTQSGITVTEQGTRWKIEVNDPIFAGGFIDVIAIIEPELAGSASINASIVSGTGGGETPTTNNINVYKFTVQ